MKKITILSLMFSTTLAFAQLQSDNPSGGTVNPLAGIVNPPPVAHNTIKFTYDPAGNQVQRQMIYLSANKHMPVADTIPMAAIPSEKLINSAEFADIKYYPNPVKSELFVKWSINGTSRVKHIQINDINGRIIGEFPDQRNSDSAVLNFENFPTGIYTLLLTYTDGNKKDLKIVKQ